MIKKILKEKKVVLYGAGAAAHNIYRAFILCGYSIAYCVVTNCYEKDCEFEGVKIYSLSEKKEEIKKKGYQIAIATLLRYEEEIIRNLNDNGITEFWKKSELPWNVDLEDYNNIDEKGYWEIIQRKYISNREKYEKEIGVRNFFIGDGTKTYNEKRITFLLLSGTTRVYKIIEALHRKGYFVELLVWVNAARIDEDTYQKLDKVSDACRLCMDVEEVMLYCISSESKIIHIFFEAWSDIELPQVLMKCKKVFSNFPAIIFDEYDVYVGINQTTIQRAMEAELYCFAHADGLCNRYRCMDSLEAQGHYICKKRIHFRDCCNDFTQYESPQKSEEDELHLVYAGIIFGDPIYQRLRCARYLEYGLRCQKNKVHLHIYPSSYDTEKLHRYIEMEKTNPYFHLHHPVSSEKLPQEISQYDYGITSGMADFLGEIDEHGIYERQDLIYSESNKFYDYLDAGLPIVAPVPIKQAEELEQDGVLIRKVDEEVDFDELRKRRNEMKKRVLEVREKYRISNQLTALIDFYDSF